MSDLETRLRDTLSERADAAPDAIGLAAGARQRLRRRRTTWAAVAVVAVVAAAVPVGLTLGSRGGEGPDTDGTPVATQRVDPVPSGFRAESWHDLTFEVPVDWGYGSTGSWCVSQGPGDTSQPVVERPDTVAMAVACSPTTGYGAVLQSTDAFDSVYDSGHIWQYQAEGVDQAWFPDDAWLGVWIGSDWALTVATPDRGLTQQIVDSARSFTGVDPNGCLSSLGEGAIELPTEGMALCRYDDANDLLGSARIDVADVAAAREALAAAPVRPAPLDCVSSLGKSRVMVIGPTSVEAWIVLGTCSAGNTVVIPGSNEVRALTDDVRLLISPVR